MLADFKKYHKFKNKIYIIGFGSIGRAVLPLLLRHLDITSTQITIISKDIDNIEVATEYQVNFNHTAITKDNYQDLLQNLLHEGDFVLNLSVDVSSVDLIKFCQEKKVLYLDTCIEPWAGMYIDGSLSPSLRSNYALRESILGLKNNKSSTAVVTHGANPGLVSHFVKQALLNVGKDNNLDFPIPTNASQWAELAQALSIKVIHIAEYDSQISKQPKKPNEFVNTWSIDGFIGEGLQPSELGWGTHELQFPHDAAEHEFGTKCAIYLQRPGAATRVRTWTPLAGPFHGFLITHGEAISIADFLTLKNKNKIQYRPTVHYAYRPCHDALLSLHELAGREYQQQNTKRLLFDDIYDGIDELGVLLMGNKKGAYWFGSQLSIQDARKLVPHNTATSLQVAVGVLAGMLWAIENPHEGLVEPDEIDFQYILNVSRQYLGNLAGFYTDWTPLKERQKLFAEKINADPWQFINFRVN